MEEYLIKRKWKKRRRRLLLFLLVLLTAGSFTGYFLHEKQLALAEEAEEVITAGEGQELLLGRIIQIIGNEMTIEVLQYEESDGRASYTSAGEEREYMVPVGAQVETKLGSVTTFSRLAAGDVVKLLLQKDGGDGEILKLWIVN